MSSAASEALHCPRLLPDEERRALLSHFEALGRRAVAAPASGGMRVWRWVDPDGHALPRKRAVGSQAPGCAPVVREALEWMPVTFAARRLPCGRWVAQLVTPLADVEASAASRRCCPRCGACSIRTTRWSGARARCRPIR